MSLLLVAPSLPLRPRRSLYGRKVDVEAAPDEPDVPGRTGAAGTTVPRHVRDQEAERLAALVLATSHGDEEAFAHLYDATSARAYGVVWRVLRSSDHAAEVTQEVYTEVWRQAARFDPTKGSALAWISTMAHRRAIDRVRSVASEVVRDEHYALAEPTREVDQVWEGVAQQLDRERVHQGLAALTPIQREAITLAYFGGFTQAQVAERLKLPLGTVKTRIRDGLIGLRTALGVES